MTNTTIPEALHALATHRETWREAITETIRTCDQCCDGVSASHWNHELKAFDSAMAAIDAYFAATPPTSPEAHVHEWKETKSYSGRHKFYKCACGEMKPLHDAEKTELDRMESLYLMALDTLGDICDALGLDSEDTEPDHIIEAIEALKATPPEAKVQVGDAIAWQPVASMPRNKNILLFVQTTHQGRVVVSCKPIDFNHGVVFLPVGCFYDDHFEWYFKEHNILGWADIESTATPQPAATEQHDKDSEVRNDAP